MSLTDRIIRRATESGFDFAGVARAAALPHAASYRRWLDRGYSAGMSWLGRGADRRADPREVLPGAKSVVIVGLSYFVQDPPPAIWNDPLRGRIARYAWGPDYHDELLPRVKDLAEFVAAATAGPAHFRTYVDTGPVLEREWAEKAGLGFIGKNTLFIHPRLGSYVFLGEILTDGRWLMADGRWEGGEAASSVGHQPSAIGHLSCARCRRCLASCPTRAFPEPYVLDSRRCISYLTIEHKGAIPEGLRRSMGNWIFGCDECQQVCPWVRKYSRPGRARFLRWRPEHGAPSLVELMGLDDRGFRDRFAGTPVLRAKRRGLLRNVAVALGNSGSADALPALEQAMRDPDPLIRGHAQWAIGQIRRRE